MPVWRRFARSGAVREFALYGETTGEIDEFGLPVRIVTSGLESQEFYIPGSILGLDVDTTHALGRGMPPRSIAWFGTESMAFEPTGAGIEMVGRYATEEALLSGWALGIDKVAGEGALAVAPAGDGQVVLFGFQPQYRGQPRATFPLFFNALRLGRAGGRE